MATPLTLESLGIESDELINRVVNRIADLTLSDYGESVDDEGNLVENRRSTQFKKKIDEMIKEKIDNAINAIAARHVLPSIEDYIERFAIQETNSWGEKKGKEMTFTEYMVQRAASYMSELVDSYGLSEGECRSKGNSFCKKTTRIAYTIDKYLYATIETSMKQALAGANTAIGTGLLEAVRTSLNNVLNSVKINVTK